MLPRNTEASSSWYSSTRILLLALLYLKDERTNPVTQQHNPGAPNPHKRFYRSVNWLKAKRFMNVHCST